MAPHQTAPGGRESWAVPVLKGAEDTMPLLGRDPQTWPGTGW
ncbi:hypothetical protein [Streptomyces canus]|nr:hypothetical protein [Streptomyces canus]WSD85217.1 hypothetical protein OG925_13325 [Streptomyces canus]